VISLRYHIVSVMAVFLALGLGIVLGSSVVSTPLDARLNADLERYKRQADEAKASAGDLRIENETLRRRLGEEIAPWAVHDRLTDLPFVFVSDGPQAPKWREHVQDALIAAGAQPQGTILLSERWQFAAPEDEDDLVSTVRSVVPSFDPEEDAASAALGIVGERFLEPTGRALVDVLTRDGFMTVQGRSGDNWPPANSTVVVLSPARTQEAGGAEDAEDTGPTPGVLSFVRSVAAVTPVLAATDAPEGSSIVTELRDQSGLADMLSTFDSSTDESDPGGIGVVAALAAATDERGGHFGAARGRAFVAPPGTDE
jgi:hypothetical protein